jgi:hypothetical protein
VYTSLGDWVGPHLGEVWEVGRKRSDSLLDEGFDELGVPEDQKAEVKEAVIWLATKKRTGNTVEAVEEKIAKRHEEQGDITTEMVNKLARLLLEERGLKTRDEVYGALCQTLAKVKPEITCREVDDLFSGYDQSAPTAQAPDGARSATIRGEGIRRSPVSSSVLRSVGYDEGEEILEIELTNGAVYRYFDLPAKVYQGLMAAESHGRYFLRHVRGAGYRYEGAN